MNKKNSFYDKGFSFIETVVSLCIVSISAAIVTGFFSSTLTCTKKLECSFKNEEVFLDTVTSLLNEVSQLEVFPYGKNLKLTYSENTFSVYSSAETYVFNFIFPEQILLKKAAFYSKDGFYTGIDFLMEYNGDTYNARTHFADYFPGQKVFP